MAADELNKHMINYGIRLDFKCYESVEHKGLYLIPNPFINGCQRFIIKKLVSEYHNQPNKTNLDFHIKRDGNLWTEAVKYWNILTLSLKSRLN